MNEKEFFAQSKNGIDVMYDPKHSHASTHFADTPQIIPVVKKIIESTVTQDDYMEFETNSGEILGTSDLVQTDETDEIVYAMRKNRDRYARFTKSRKPQPSSIVTVRLEKIDDGHYDLYSAWLGPATPPFPGSDHETPESRPFWSTHALAWGTQEIQAETETSNSPW